MMDNPLLLKVNGSLLRAVPGIHFRAPFAEHVFRICSCEDTRPDAIVVELGIQSLTAVISLMKKIGIGVSPFSMKLPCMLGLIKDMNSSLESAGRQNSSASFFNETDRLRASVELLPLSPIDSIIESVRCALEFDLPVYGVDIEDIPTPDHKPVMHEDPAAAQTNLAAYVSDNAGMAEFSRDRKVDGLREMVMAARLKSILQRHRNVLFVCGLAHWNILKRFIRNPEFDELPVQECEEDGTNRFSSVLVHPLLALNYLDLFPLVAESYERARDTVFYRKPIKTLSCLIR